MSHKSAVCDAKPVHEPSHGLFRCADETQDRIGWQHDPAMNSTDKTTI